MFYPGKEIRGDVVVDVAQSMKCKAINVIVAGVSYCEFNHGKAGQRIYSQLLFQRQYRLFGESSTRAIQHPSGRHTYRFLFKLPSPLPSSFDVDYGHIEYFIAARVVRPWKFDSKAHKSFTVNGIVDINLPQYSTVPAGTAEKQIGCLACASGNLRKRATTDKSGYYPGEKIFLNAMCENFSTREMRCMRATLVQNILYRTDGGKTERKSKAIARFEGESIPGGRQDAWNNQPLLIPPVPPTTETHPVSVSYQVKFDVKVPWGLNPKIKLDTVA